MSVCKKQILAGRSSGMQLQCWSRQQHASGNSTWAVKVSKMEFVDGEGIMLILSKFWSIQAANGCNIGVWLEDAAVQNHRKHRLEDTSGGHPVPTQPKSKEKFKGTSCCSKPFPVKFSTSLSLEVPQWHLPQWIILILLLVYDWKFPCCNLSLLPFILSLCSAVSWQVWLYTLTYSSWR